ncbi:MAG: DUF4249 domain-containing protein [Bacteroidales bacterium]|nr:DUF4249 domain-containing protein [Bacteroidales bacterium]
MKLAFSFSLVLLFLLSSCTEEISIDLNSADPQLVIEGNLIFGSEEAIIQITESVNFDADNSFPPVQDAFIEISDDEGNTLSGTEVSPGTYAVGPLTELNGNSYMLQVEVGEKLYIAQSTMPEQVPFLSLQAMKISGRETEGGAGFRPTMNYNVIATFADPANTDNYYRFIEYVNGEKSGEYLFSDRLTDGVTEPIILRHLDRVLESGDTLLVEMQCIDQNVYDYFMSLDNLMGGPANSVTPANPTTNIEGAVLGYFSAHTSVVKEIIIP